MSIHQPNLVNHPNPIRNSHQHLSSHHPHHELVHRSSQAIPNTTGQIPNRPLITKPPHFSPSAFSLNSLPHSFNDPLIQLSTRNQPQLASNSTNAPLHSPHGYFPPPPSASFTTHPSLSSSSDQLTASTHLGSSALMPLFSSQAPVFNIDSFYLPLASQPLASTQTSSTEPAPPLSLPQAAPYPLAIASLPQDPSGPSCFPFPPPAPLQHSSQSSPLLQDSDPRQATLSTSAPAPGPGNPSGAEPARRVSLDCLGGVPPPASSGYVAPTEQPSGAWPPLPSATSASPVDLREPRSARPRSPQAGDRSPRAQISPPRMRTLQTAPAQDFKRRKEWPQRLVGDVGDVLALVGTDGQLLFASESIGRVTGFGAGALLGTAVYDLCFAEEDRTNLRREVGLCASSGRDMNVYCRFRRSGQEGVFVILEMLGRLIRLRPDAGRAVREGICINARPYPTSCGELMDEFLELMLENAAMEQMLAEARAGEKRPAAPPDAPEERSDEPDGCGAPDDDPGWTSPTEGSGGGQRKRAKRDKTDFLCLECGVTDSPEWRKGPRGRKTLCNACGLRYAKKAK